MKALTARKKVSEAKIGKLPVVILPLEDYEGMVEDLEMLQSRALPRKIRKAREETCKGRVTTLAEVKKKLKLSRTFTPTAAEKKALASARKRREGGEYLTLDELRRALVTRR